jgi:hypothetical protein
VTVTATPSSVVLESVDSTDGGVTFHQVTHQCTGPGSAFDSTKPAGGGNEGCSLTWSWPSAHYGSGTFPLTVTVTYGVAWTGTGGRGTLPAITRSSTEQFAVGEIEAVGS